MVRPGGSARSVLRGGARRRRAKKRRRIEVAAPRGRGRSRRGRPLAGKADGGGACPTYFMPGQSGQSEGRRRGGDRTRRESGLRRGYGLLGAKRRKGNVVATPTRPARKGAERLRDTTQRRGRQSQFRRERRGGRAKWPPAESPLQNKNFPEGLCIFNHEGKAERGNKWRRGSKGDLEQRARRPRSTRNRAREPRPTRTPTTPAGASGHPRPGRAPPRTMPPCPADGGTDGDVKATAATPALGQRTRRRERKTRSARGRPRRRRRRGREGRLIPDAAQG